MTGPMISRQTPRRHPAKLILLVVLAACLLFGFSMWNLSAGYRTALIGAQSNADNLARAFASHVRRSVGETSRIIDAISREVARFGEIHRVPEAILHKILVDVLKDAPQLQGAVIVDPSGAVVAGSLNYPEQRVDVSDREYFQWHRENPSRTMRVGAAARSRITDQRFIGVTRRIDIHDGDFGGVVVGALDPGYFSDFYRMVTLPGRSFVELADRHGQILARGPVVGNGLGADERLVPENGDGAVRVAVANDGGRFLISRQQVDGLSLEIAVATELDEVLAHWRRLAWEHGLVTLVSVIVLLWLLYVLYRRTVRLESSEAAARQLVRERDQILKSIPDAVIVSDIAGNTVVSNPAAEAVYGSSLQTASPGDRAEQFGLFTPDGSAHYPEDELPLGRAIRGESVDDVEILVRNTCVPEGARFLISARPILGADGAIEGGILICRNITTLRETEHRLIQAQKMDVVGQLTGGIAHDFNNLLTVILGNSELLSERLDQPRLKELADVTARAAQRGAELTHHLLAFARRQPLAPKPVDVGRLVVGMEGLLRRVLTEDIDIRLVLAEQAGIAYIDSAQLESSLLNLAINARDAMPQGGRLTIETQSVRLDREYADSHSEVEPGAYVLIAVSDTGTGIPEQVLERVFEPFFTTKPTGKGTGLGLSMVYGFIKQSSGHVSIYSECGSGTTIKLYLPRSESDRVEESPPVEPLQQGSFSASILVVEDDDLVREHVEMQLRQLGYQVTSRGDGQAALEVLRGDTPIDLLFTDVIMPGGMGGRELAEQARDLRPGIRILFTSGYTENSIIHHGRLDAGVDLLQKPYRRADLERKIREVLTRAAG